MYGDRWRRHNFSRKVLPNMLCHKRNNRWHNKSCSIKCIIKHPISSHLIFFIAGFPEATTICPYIPIWYIVNKYLKFFYKHINFIVIIKRFSFFQEFIGTNNKPYIRRSHRRLVRCVIFKIRLIDFCICLKKCINIPIWKKLSSRLIAEIITKTNIVWHRSTCI